MNRTWPIPWKPTKAQLLAAHKKLAPDLAAKTLIALFAGITPGLYTAAVGRHFGRPGNRFWPALHGGGFTPRLFSPFEESLLLDLKCPQGCPRPWGRLHWSKIIALLPAAGASAEQSPLGASVV